MNTPSRDWRQKLHANALKELFFGDRFLPTVLFALTGLAIAMGVLLRVSLLGSGSLWMDELWTLDAVSRSFTDMIGARLVSDQSPPLWTMLSWVWLNVVGTYDTVWMRILPAAFGCLGIAAPIVGAVRMRALRPTLLVMASLIALSLFTIQYAVEFRAYSMMIGLGSVSTVIWAGMLTDQLPRSGRWIFVFALTGALAGFGHYYGNIPYAFEGLILLAIVAWGRNWRCAGVLCAWGFLSILPVTAWYELTNRYMTTGATVAPPSFAVVQQWLTYAFAPVTNVLANDPPGYPEGARGDGVMVAVLIAILIVAGAISYVFYALWRKWRTAGPPPVTAVLPPVTAAGMWAFLVVVAGICFAWALSVLTSPSMNFRHLAAFLPPLFLAAASACTLLPGRARWLTASIAVAALVAVNSMAVSQYGVAALTPPWQEQAGYRDASRVLIAASHELPAPTRIGLNTSWEWHGQWDATIRGELGAKPAVSSDPEPLAVMWINGVQDIKPIARRGPVIVFGDFPDQRQADLFAWAERTIGSCTTSTYGGSYGRVTMLRCG